MTKNNYLFRNGRVWLAGSGLCLLFCFLSFIPIVGPGIDQPTPIGAYLNGVFPPQAPSGDGSTYDVVNAFPNLIFQDPMTIIEVPDENSYYVVGKSGFIWQIANNPNTTSKNEVLNISDRVDIDGDSGLLNAILHPEFGQSGSPNRGYLYMLYRFHPEGDVSECGDDAFVRLSRFNRPDGSNNFDPNSEFVLVQVFDEQCWHNGGGMFFDDEGYFYFTIGDAGGANDEYNTTQSLNSRLLSGLFRIDLEMDASRSHPIRRQQVDPPGMSFDDYSSFSQGYFIPNDNPWQDVNGGILEEFFALGLRSPHRASWDPVTGDIYVGDVGQARREEVSKITKGSNLQWPFREGSISGPKSQPNPLIGVSTPPALDYNRSDGNSVIGGFVYRGSGFQGDLSGKYIFGDHGLRNVWTFNPANQEVAFLLRVPYSGNGDKNGIASFATNSNGDIFILKLYGTAQNGGIIYKLRQTSFVPEPPALLSATGAFTDLNNMTPAPGIVPYTVNAPLWSDRAEKQRWIALPNDGTHNTANEQIAFSETGGWQFPVGTVFIKHFELPVDYQNPSVTQKLETRFLIIAQNGGTYGVTYKWRADGSDADLLESGDTQVFNIANGSPATQTWEFPGRADCLTCHNANAGFVLGLQTWQLNGDFTYPSGMTDNQLNTWNHLGMFANSFDPADIPGFLQSVPIGDDSQAEEVRVRSYLDANCAHCHRPGGVEGAFDARFSTPLENQNLVNAPVLSRNSPASQYIVKPNNTAASELWVRDGSLAENAMPPLAKNLVHEEYMAVLTAWINSFSEDCIELEESYCASGDCLIEENPIPSGNYLATQRITANTVVASSSDVQFKAGYGITLQPGFRVGAGTAFHAEIIPCQSESQPAALAEQNPVSISAERIDNKGSGERASSDDQLSQAQAWFSRPDRTLSVKVRPNPFRDEFRLQIEAPFPELKRAVIRVMDVNGRIFYQRYDAPFNQEITVFSHDGWANGIYYLEIIASDYRFIKTVVKQ